MSIFCVSAECFYDCSIYSMRRNLTQKKKKKSSFSEKRRKKQHTPYPLGFDSVYVRHYCIYHTRKLSTSTGFCALELQVPELGLNPVIYVMDPLIFPVCGTGGLLQRTQPSSSRSRWSSLHLDRDQTATKYPVLLLLHGNLFVPSPATMT